MNDETLDSEELDVCDICGDPIEDYEESHEYHFPACPNYRTSGVGDQVDCLCAGLAHAHCCPECKEEDSYQASQIEGETL